MSDNRTVATLLPPSLGPDEHRGSEAPANGPAGSTEVARPDDIAAAHTGPMEPRQEVN